METRIDLLLGFCENGYQIACLVELISTTQDMEQEKKKRTCLESVTYSSVFDVLRGSKENILSVVNNVIAVPFDPARPVRPIR